MADRNRFRNNPVYVDYHLFICILVEQEYMGRSPGAEHLDVNRDFQFLLGGKKQDGV